MREIKFRGKSTMKVSELDQLGIEHENGWVFGNLIVNVDSPYIVGDIEESNWEYIAHEFWVKVNAETVGQFTGLKDKNGIEIYEGDIVKGVNFKLHVEYISKVKWHKNGYWYAFNKDNKGIGFLKNIELLEVIGNIYENPWLLEVEVDG